MVGSYGLVQLEDNEYTTYIYQTLKQWQFGPTKGKDGLQEGELRLTIEADEPGSKPTFKYFQFAASEDMTPKQKCDYISRAMMSCAMAERADTFSTTLALKVLRLQVRSSAVSLCQLCHCQVPR
jgi:phage-related baseplate assembly protein